jgi:hypothetical protein
MCLWSEAKNPLRLILGLRSGELLMTTETAICTWFVKDEDGDATFFPQVGLQSNTPEAQAIYWRCIAGFFVSSLLLNRGRPHLCFTNTSLPVIAGVNFGELFAKLGVEVVTLPITFRLRAGAVAAWGNQFYILDVLDWLARQARFARAIVLDSDCVWIKPADDIEAAIDRHGVLTYELGTCEHAAREPINGLTREGMARFLASTGGPAVPTTPYYGGEIFAATHAQIVRIIADARDIWGRVEEGGPDTPKEEAHLLSVLYARRDIAGGTANSFIRRIWTNLTHYNASPEDLALAIWHLPSAKRFGFAALFERVAAGREYWADPSKLGINQALYERVFGVPRRTCAVTVPMLRYKLGEKAASVAAALHLA